MSSNLSRRLDLIDQKTSNHSESLNNNPTNAELFEKGVPWDDTDFVANYLSASGLMAGPARGMKNAVSESLAAAGVPFHRDVYIGGDLVDFMTDGGLVIMVSSSRKSALSSVLARLARSARVTGLIVVTTARFASQNDILGKPFAVALATA